MSKFSKVDATAVCKNKQKSERDMWLSTIQKVPVRITYIVCLLYMHIIAAIAHKGDKGIKSK